MAEKNPKKMKTQSEFLRDSDSSEKEVSQHLRTSLKERLYSTVKGLAQVTQAAQCNPTVERGPSKQPQIKRLLKGQTSDKGTQTKKKDKSL